MSVRKDRDLGTHLTGISSNTQRVTLRRGGGGGFVGGGALSRSGAKVLVIHLRVLGHLDHGHLELAVGREEREVHVTDGDVVVRRAVEAEPAKCMLDLEAANLEVPVSVVGSATDLRRELHHLDVGSKAGEKKGKEEGREKKLFLELND